MTHLLLIYRLKMVVFHSYVKLPEGTMPQMLHTTLK